MTDELSTNPEVVDPEGEVSPLGAKELTRIKSRGFFPADHAAVENGKVYVSGAYWSLLRFPAFPAVLPTMSLVAIVEVPFHAYQADHLLEIQLVDPDGNLKGLRVEGSFRSAPKLETKYGQSGLAPLVAPVLGLTIERPGDYIFTLSVDRKIIDRYPFSVIQVASVAILQGPTETEVE
jgi:hypothetical protein